MILLKLEEDIFIVGFVFMRIFIELVMIFVVFNVLLKGDVKI